MAKQKKDSAPAENTAEELREETKKPVTEENQPEPAQVTTREDELAAALNTEKDKFLRLAAEYDNFRKRSLKEKESVYCDVRADTILQMLPVYDNLSRALANECSDESFYKGVEMTMIQFKSILGNLNVTEIPAVGKKFDPSVHNAVMHVENENYGEQEIVIEYEKGFKLGDKVLRFSAVQVAN